MRLRAPKSQAKWLLATSYSISVWISYQQIYQRWLLDTGYDALFGVENFFVGPCLGAILVTSPQRLAAKAAAHECSCAVDGRFGAWKLIAEAVEELAAKKGLGVRRYYQRTNENTNGLLRQYFPKGTNFLSIPELPHSIALRLNQRPRKTLGFETPTNKLRKVLH